MNAQAHFHNIQSALLEQLQSAKEKVYVSVYFLMDEQLFNCLCDLVANAIRVALMIHDIPANEKV